MNITPSYPGGADAILMVPMNSGLPISPGESGNPPNKGAIRVHTDSVHKPGTPVAILSVALDSVLFSDGTMVGPDKMNVWWLLSVGFGMDKPQALRALLSPDRLKGGK